MSGESETWPVQVAPAAARALDRLPHRASGAIVGFITGILPADSRLLSRPLRHELSGWRVARRGDYRVTFRILEDDRLLLIGRIEHRSQWALELAAALPVPADRWQRREQEVDEHVAAGRVTVHDDGEAFLEHLDHLDGEADDGASQQQ